jgi:hypothetical protein
MTAAVGPMSVERARNNAQAIASAPRYAGPEFAEWRSGQMTQSQHARYSPSRVADRTQSRNARLMGRAHCQTRSPDSSRLCHPSLGLHLSSTDIGSSWFKSCVERPATAGLVREGESRDRSMSRGSGRRAASRTAAERLSTRAQGWLASGAVSRRCGTTRVACRNHFVTHVVAWGGYD